MKKAFTLIEVLASLILLGIIGMIIIPLVNRIVKNSDQASLEETISSIEKAAYNYSNEFALNTDGGTNVIMLEVLKESGFIKNEDIINPVTNEVLQGCVLYRWNESHKQFEFNYSDECTTANLEILITNINGEFNAEGWAKQDFYVNVSTNNSAEKFKYCVSSSTCTPTTTVNSASQAVLISLEGVNTNLCAYSFNSTDTSETICMNYKLDKTNPVVGTLNIAGTLGTNDFYTSNVTITSVDGSDALSGHDATSANISSVNENSITTVTVTTIDKAGNVSIKDYTVKVDKTTPSVLISRSVVSGQVVLSSIVTPSTTTSGYTYTWYKDDNIVGVTTPNLQVPSSGTYKVKVTTGAGLSSFSNSETVSGYTITYNGNGGSNVSSQMKLQDIDINITNEVPTRAGYQFLGWAESATAKEAVYNSNDIYSLNSNKTLYAIWKKTLTVAFNGNGTTLSKTSDSCDIYNAEGSCSITTPVITTQSGYTKLGFNLSANATTATVSENGTLTLTETGLIYYAISYRDLVFNFNKNNASSISKTSDTCRIWNTTQSCNITTPTITAPGSLIDGFGASASSTVKVVDANANMNLNVNNAGGTYYAITREVTLMLSESSGTLTTSNIKNVNISGSNYGNLTCSSANANIATCNISSNTLHMNSTNEVGTVIITVTESNLNKTVNYELTVVENAYMATANYNCNEGTLNGTSCVLSISKESYRYCSSGDLSGENCVTTTTSSPSTGYNYSCPTGYTPTSGVTSTTTCKKTTTSTTSPNSSTSYSCPSGYSPSSGVTSTTTCSKTTTTTSASVGTTTYSCPTGYSASGTITASTTCSKTTTSTASSVAKYKCPSGYSASGTITASTTCSKTTKTNPTGIKCSNYGSGYYTCTNWSASNAESHKHCIKDVAIQCPSGYISDSYTLCVKQGIQSCNGSTACLASYRKLESEGGTAKLKSNLECPAGAVRFQGNEYQSDDYYIGTCYIEKRAQNSDMICASGTGTYNSSSGKCEKTESTAAVLDKYECPSGYSASGTITASTTCSKSTTTTAASVGTTTYSCPSGYSATGTITSTTTCSKSTTTTTSPSSSTSYYCPSGYSPSGSVSYSTTCSKSTTTTSSPNSSPYQYCATGTLSNGVCVVTNQTTAQTGYRCPEGYTSTGESQTASCVKQIDANVTYTCPNGGTLSNNMCIR